MIIITIIFIIEYTLITIINIVSIMIVMIRLSLNPIKILEAGTPYQAIVIYNGELLPSTSVCKHSRDN